MNLLYQEFIGNVVIDRSIKEKLHRDCHFCRDDYCMLNHKKVGMFYECCNDFFLDKKKNGAVYTDSEYQLWIINGNEPFSRSHYVSKNERFVEVRFINDAIRVVQLLNNDDRINDCIVIDSERKMAMEVEKELNDE